MDTKKRFKRWLKLRFAVVYPFGFFMLFFCNPTDSSLKAGIGFIIIGLLIRLWASGYAIKMEKLTTSGPYAFVRHPLYLGTMFIAIGFVIMLKASYAGAIFIIAMIFLYNNTIKKEEKMLEDKFKGAFTSYKKAVPALVPKIPPYRTGEKWPFDIRRSMQNKEYKIFLWTIILILVFRLKAYLVVEHKPMDGPRWMLLISAFMLGMIDLVTELMKIRKKRLVRSKDGA